MGFIPVKWMAFPAADLAAWFSRVTNSFYEFDAEPFGLHLYHCHVFRLRGTSQKASTARLLSIQREVGPRVDREMIMVMSGFDIDFDDVNDFYAVNAIPFYYQNHPIQIHVV